MPPGADGRPVTWRSLLALGVSGGLLPCPSALVVLLSAIALQRVAFGMLLNVFASMDLLDHPAPWAKEILESCLGKK